MLHLQCHFGLDTLSWAREGAVVTGVDFSEAAIAQARALAAECGIDARFVVSDVYAAPEKLDARFDIVFTGYGALIWLPDMTRWARVVSHFLKPGGTFYIAEFHPFESVFDDEPGVEDLRVRYPYFPQGAPVRFESEFSYAGPSVQLEHRTTYEWPHGIGEVVTALIDAGLRIEFLHEFPFTPWSGLPFVEPIGRRMVRLAKHDGCVPMMYSLRARKG